MDFPDSPGLPGLLGRLFLLPALQAETPRARGADSFCDGGLGTVGVARGGVNWRLLPSAVVGYGRQGFDRVWRDPHFGE